jgi:hypothetical protein
MPAVSCAISCNNDPSKLHSSRLVQGPVEMAMLLGSLTWVDTGPSAHSGRDLCSKIFWRN